MNLLKTIEDLASTMDLNSISNERKETLQPLLSYIQNKIEVSAPVLLNFICTHNSRRSHLAQIWAQTWAHHFGLPHVQSFSGGTEDTAVFQSVINALKTCGFRTIKVSESRNQVYGIQYSENSPALIAFSKKYDHAFNPSSGFCAILTCDQADQDCPIVYGAEKRVALPYVDPKKYDNTPEQEAKYLEKSIEIATELYYVFSNINLK